jgi:hypothetical protein
MKQQDYQDALNALSAVNLSGLAHALARAVDFDAWVEGYRACKRGAGLAE